MMLSAMTLRWQDYSPPGEPSCPCWRSAIVGLIGFGLGD